MTKQQKNPSGIGEKLKRLIAVRGYTVWGAARAMRVSNPSLYEAINERVALTAKTAARLSRIGIDGRALYLEQASNKLAVYEAEVEAEDRLQEIREKRNRAG